MTPKMKTNQKIKTTPKMWKAQKLKTTQKMEKKKKSTQKLKTATAHATFPPDYHSKNALRPVMMFIVETGNRNPHV